MADKDSGEELRGDSVTSYPIEAGTTGTPATKDAPISTQARDWLASAPAAKASGPRILTRADILHMDDRKYELVEVPEWGQGSAVWVRSLTAGERDQYEASNFKQRADGTRILNTDHLRARLVALSIVDNEIDGRPLFSTEDVVFLSDKNAAAMQRVWNVAQRLSGISDDDIAELAKNSGTTHGRGSSSV